MSHKLKLACLGGLVLMGCGQSQPDGNANIPLSKATPLGVTESDESSARRREPGERLIGGMKFEIPADWEEKPSNGIVLTEYSLPGDAGPGRLTFSTVRGGTSANIERWKAQFQRTADDPEPQESPLSVAGKEATFLEVHGTFSDMFTTDTPRKNWQLLGVAIPIDADQNYFVKLTGPNETLNARREQLLSILKSARFE